MTVRSATSSHAVQEHPPIDTSPQTRHENAVAHTANVSTFSGKSNPNAILNKYTPTGASEQTAWNQVRMHAGVAASHKMAQQDLPKLEKYKGDIEAVAAKHNLPPALLAAIISRESRGGSALDSRGYGDNGHGYGLMQVDIGTAKGRGGPYSRANIEQGAEILMDKLKSVKAEHPNWPPEQQLRGAVAAYNMGAKNVQTIGGMDKGSTGNDYSNDVWARAQALAPHFGGAAQGTGGKPDLGGGKTDPTPHTPHTGGSSAPHLDTSGHTLLREGASGPSVKHLQEALKAAGFNPGGVDGQYGPKTEAAVKAFQRAHHLAVDGIAGPHTNAALNKATEHHPAASGGGHTGTPHWTQAPSLADVKSGKAVLKQGEQGTAVKDLQRMLGVTADGKFGQDTAHALADFKRAHHLGGPATEAGEGTLQALKKEEASGGAVVGNYTVDTNNPKLHKLATGSLENGPTGYCVATTLKNMGRLGVPHAPATGADVGNNPRGGMVQMVKNYGWKSLPLPGSKLETIKSPAYGTIQANVVPAAEYAKLARAGKIPSGALIFQTRHDSWNSTSQGSHGFDMGIVRNGGRNTFNYANMPPLVYGDAKSVVILVPGDALHEK